MSWSVATSGPIPKSQIDSLAQDPTFDNTQRDQLNVALTAANSLAKAIGDEQSYVEVSASCDTTTIEVKVHASPAPAPAAKVPYPEGIAGVDADREAKRAARTNAAQVEVEEAVAEEAVAEDDAATLEGEDVPDSFQGAAPDPNEAVVAQAQAKGRGFGKGRK